MPELLEGVGCAQNRFHRFDVWGHTLATLAAATVEDPVVRLGALLHDVGKPRSRLPKDDAPGEYSFWKHEFIGAEMAVSIAQRLKLPNAERESVRLLVANHMFFYTPEWSDGTVRRFVRKVGVEALPGLLALRQADVTGRGFGEDPDKETRELRGRIDEVASADAALKVTDLAVDGRDVMQALGRPAGRVVGQVLEALLERVLDDPSLNTKEKLLELVPVVAAEPSSPGGR
jgi:tRNA nucleotidyltransferase (CCA-adding enzyme)